MIFGGKNIGGKMCVLILSTTFVQNTSRPKNNSARYYNIYYRSLRKVNVILMTLPFSRHIFGQPSNTKLH